MLINYWDLACQWKPLAAHPHCAMRMLPSHPISRAMRMAMRACTLCCAVAAQRAVRKQKQNYGLPYVRAQCVNAIHSISTPDVINFSSNLIIVIEIQWQFNDVHMQKKNMNWKFRVCDWMDYCMVQRLMASIRFWLNLPHESDSHYATDCVGATENLMQGFEIAFTRRKERKNNAVVWCQSENIQSASTLAPKHAELNGVSRTYYPSSLCRLNNATRMPISQNLSNTLRSKRTRVISPDSRQHLAGTDTPATDRRN